MNTNDLNAVEGGQDLASISRELENIRDGLKTLGLKQCSCCGKYFMFQDGRNLLNVGQLVCFKCIGSWWAQRSPKISIEERNTVEDQLFRWLITHHEARVIRHMSQLPPVEKIELKLVVRCEQCNGRGLSGATKCHACDGLGCEWVVIAKP